MGSVESLQTYFTSVYTVGILSACIASIITFVYIFIADARNPKLRTSVLSALFSISIFFWIFIAMSFVICMLLSEELEYSTTGVKLTFTSSVLIGIIMSIAISVLVWKFASRRIIKKLDLRELSSHETYIKGNVTRISENIEIEIPMILILRSKEPVSMVIGGKSYHLILSEGLIEILEKKELETVIAHELMHIKNDDCKFKLFSSIFSKIMFFDPFSKFFDPAVHREREYLADEMAGKITKKPATLASALLKIGEGNQSNLSILAGLSIIGPSGGLFCKYPPLKNRIARLLDKD